MRVSSVLFRVKLALRSARLLLRKIASKIKIPAVKIPKFGNNDENTKETKIDNKYKMSGDLRCSVCKNKIKSNEFMAMIGKNKFEPPVSYENISNDYQWVIGIKKYCKNCYDKESRGRQDG